MCLYWETCSQTIDSQPLAALPTSQPLYHYIIVRAGLPAGITAAQICHAAGESSPGNLPSGTFAVVLSAPKDALEALEAKLQLAGLPHRSIRENDPPYSGDLLAIGICPTYKKEVKRFVSALPLVK